MSLSTAGDFSADPPVALFADWFTAGVGGSAYYDVAPDGRFLTVGGETPVATELCVVLNWAQELTSRAGNAGGGVR